jgi:hypothetical protein
MKKLVSEFSDSEFNVNSEFAKLGSFEPQTSYYLNYSIVSFDEKEKK